MRRLNVGAGPDRDDAWESLDKAQLPPAWPPVDHWVDLGRDRIGVYDCTFDSIVASHSLQQIEYHAIGPALRELHRVLDHGGTLRVIMPDVARAVDAWLHGRLSHFLPLIDDETERTLDGKFCAYLTWYSTARCVWTAEAFIDQLHRAGFPVVAQVSPHHTRGYDPMITRWDRRESESFFVEAVRP